MTRFIVVAVFTFGSLLYGAICADNAMPDLVGMLAVCIPSEEDCPDNPMDWRTVIYSGDQRKLANLPTGVLASFSLFGLDWSAPELFAPRNGQSIELYLVGESPTLHVRNVSWCPHGSF